MHAMQYTPLIIMQLGILWPVFLHNSFEMEFILLHTGQASDHPGNKTKKDVNKILIPLTVCFNIDIKETCLQIFLLFPLREQDC
jgi:hypothetical protein